MEMSNGFSCLMVILALNFSTQYCGIFGQGKNLKPAESHCEVKALQITAVARQWLSSDHVGTPTDERNNCTATEELCLLLDLC
jgi:hypothetical protein